MRFRKESQQTLLSVSHPSRGEVRGHKMHLKMVIIRLHLQIRFRVSCPATGRICELMRNCINSLNCCYHLRGLDGKERNKEGEKERIAFIHVQTCFQVQCRGTTALDIIARRSLLFVRNAFISRVILTPQGSLSCRYGEEKRRFPQRIMA